MEKSEQINELAAALAKAQGEMTNAIKSSDNPFYKSKYADLAEVLDTCREVLSKNGLSVAQPVGQVSDKNIEVYTILMHSSGQWISSSMNIPMTKIDPQAAGSAITYARRYSLAAMVGIAQADDDGEKAMPLVRKTKDGIMVFTQGYANLNNLSKEILENLLKDIKYKDVWGDIKKKLNIDKPDSLKDAENLFGGTTKKLYTNFDNGVWMLLSKNNGQWADARKVPLERLNDMLNDSDYAPAHDAIRSIMAGKK